MVTGAASNSEDCQGYSEVHQDRWSVVQRSLAEGVCVCVCVCVCVLRGTVGYSEVHQDRWSVVQRSLAEASVCVCVCSQGHSDTPQARTCVCVCVCVLRGTVTLPRPELKRGEKTS